MDPGYQPAPRWLELGEGFSDVVEPAVFPQRILRWRDADGAAQLGLHSLDEARWLSHFACFEPLPGNLPQPHAVRYHGHQFRHYNPELGDGRGFLFAQCRNEAGELIDLSTKGSGTTPYSRGGDGRLTLRGGVRELLAARLLEALGVPVNRVLSLVETGESLLRFDEPSPTRAMVMVRAQRSCVRVGNFQRLHSLGDKRGLRRLLEHCVSCWHPDLGDTNLPLAFLRRVTERSADLVAGWTLAGFVHGVLNTDNLNITGESFDHGPWRFVPRCDPAFTAAYFDEIGLYAYGRQAGAVLWTLQRLGEALSPLEPSARLAGDMGFSARFADTLSRGICLRLGLRSRGGPQDRALLRAVSNFLVHSPVGFERFFFDWYGGLASATRAQEGPERACYQGPLHLTLLRALEGYEPTLSQALDRDYFQQDQPCTLLHGEVDALLDDLAVRDDWAALDFKLAEISRMGLALLNVQPLQSRP